MMMMLSEAGFGSYGAISTNHLNVNYRLEGGAESSECIEGTEKKKREESERRGRERGDKYQPKENYEHLQASSSCLKSVEKSIKSWASSASSPSKMACTTCSENKKEKREKKGGGGEEEEEEKLWG